MECHSGSWWRVTQVTLWFGVCKTHCHYHLHTQKTAKRNRWGWLHPGAGCEIRRGVNFSPHNIPGGKLHSYGAFTLQVKFIAGETRQKIRFAYSWVSDQHHCKQNERMVTINRHSQDKKVFTSLEPGFSQRSQAFAWKVRPKLSDQIDSQEYFPLLFLCVLEQWIFKLLHISRRPVVKLFSSFCRDACSFSIQWNSVNSTSDNSENCLTQVLWSLPR